MTDCDSPFALVNATFDWIAANLKDRIDFVIWTGDSARHGNDEARPRTQEQVLDLNRYCVGKFAEVFGTGDLARPFAVPVVPTLGNKDILPHNIFHPGPNPWTRAYLDVWGALIPEAQRHDFDRGGWFWTEVVPGRLAVVSLNSLYFYTKNTAVDGCASPDQSGYEHFEWLRTQLQLLRKRGLKVILMGHVPPARTENKQSWDESCWQKYTLWTHQFRDILVGSVWGHANNDHFILQDFEDVSKKGLRGDFDSQRAQARSEISVQRTTDYLNELREKWAKLPTPPEEQDGSRHDVVRSKKRRKDDDEKRNKKKKFFKKIGGPWAERYTVDLVSPSMIPNYFPTLRIVEYNVTGAASVPQGQAAAVGSATEDLEKRTGCGTRPLPPGIKISCKVEKEPTQTTKRGFKKPKDPSETAPPGPAHSPQTFSFLSYQQLYANLTTLNNDFDDNQDVEDSVDASSWHDGKHPDEVPKSNETSPPREFTFEVEYNTRNDSTYYLPDLTVRSWLGLAARIGKFKPEKGDILPSADESRTSLQSEKPPSSEHGERDQPELDVEKEGKKKHKKKHKKHKKKKKKKKHGKRKIINRTWYAFVERAYVGTLEEEELHDQFGRPDPDAAKLSNLDGET